MFSAAKQGKFKKTRTEHLQHLLELHCLLSSNQLSTIVACAIKICQVCIIHSRKLTQQKRCWAWPDVDKLKTIGYNSAMFRKGNQSKTTGPVGGGKDPSVVASLWSLFLVWSVFLVPDHSSSPQHAFTILFFDHPCGTMLKYLPSLFLCL